MRRLLAPWLIWGAWPGAAAAQTVVTFPAPNAESSPTIVVSPAPQRVALTIYRAPYARGAIDLRYLGGFALVTEERQVRLPRGPAVLRLEGVAEGIVPVSALVENLPGGVAEKNRDARLLSPAALIDGTLGRQVTLTRTNRATGRTTSEQATIVAGPTPGVVLQTASGIETLRCSGLPERLTFAGVPAGLSSKPVLSVATNSASARSVTVRVSYLASGFDWRASYVATVAADGRALDLFAWLTLANANPETFARAEVSAVAGRLNRVVTPALRQAVERLSLRCYPLGTTTSRLPSMPPPVVRTEDIIVTGARVFAPPAVFAPAPPPPPPPPPPEDLGDLKLYRVSEAVTVSPRGQKQVALLAQSAVPFERRYRRRVSPSEGIKPSPTTIMLRVHNSKADHLGIPLPSGSTATYARVGEERLLLGLGRLDDRAEGETFRLVAGTSAQVLVEQVLNEDRQSTLRASNAGRAPAVLDVPIGTAGQKITSDDPALAQVDGVATWTVTLPPGGRAELRYRY